MYGLQCQFRLFLRCQSADNSPGLRVQPHACFRIVLRTDDLSILLETTDETVVFPAQTCEKLAQLRLSLIQICKILCVLLFLCILFHYGKCIVQLERNEGRLALLTQTQAVIPIGVKSGRHAMIAQMLHREIDGSLQVVINGTLVAVRVRDDLVDECGVARLTQILLDGREEPQSIVCTICGMAGCGHIGSIVRCILMSCIMVELNERKSAAVVNLCGKHEADLLTRSGRIQMDHALDILNGVTIAITITKSAVDEGSRAGPDECHEALISVPCIDHRVEVLIRCLNLEVLQFGIPVLLELAKFLFCLRRICITLQQLLRLFVVILAEQEYDLLRLAGLQCDLCGQCAAGVVVVVEMIAQVAALNADRVSVTAVAAQEGRLIAAVRTNGRTDHAEETLTSCGRMVLAGSIRAVLIDRLNDLIAVEIGACDKQCVLQVYEVVLVVALVGELHETGRCDRALLIRIVSQLQLPNFISLIQGNIIQYLGSDLRVLRGDAGISQTMTALTLVILEIFADRLPGCRPVIAGLLITQVDVPSGGIIFIEMIADDTSLRSALYETVAACIIGNDGAVLRRAEVIGPGCRCVRTSDHVLFVRFIKKTVLHRTTNSFDLFVRAGNAPITFSITIGLYKNNVLFKPKNAKSAHVKYDTTDFSAPATLSKSYKHSPYSSLSFGNRYGSCLFGSQGPSCACMHVRDFSSLVSYQSPSHF